MSMKNHPDRRRLSRFVAFIDTRDVALVRRQQWSEKRCAPLCIAFFDVCSGV